jgi:hypothetical protein
MPDPSSFEVIRAAADAMFPATDGKPGAADLGVERHIVEQAEGALPGSADLIATLLNAYAAAVREGADFLALTPDERRQAMRAMLAEESQDIREVVETVQVFATGGMYSEWRSFDAEKRELERPAIWDDIGYHGPVDGVAEYREDV